ncbi:hypothetical protein QCA50_011333 [Cerrena zonata]|uniref:RlpA-like protein double-psi beta-barrel domain-containing protein n=1 Tax=Cerrena zonata TaxID=2478898 RepID=A0AAW0G1B7_9APHY
MLRTVVTLTMLATLYARTAIAYTGEATWYHAGKGACGFVNKASDHIVALSPYEYLNGRSCLKNITVQYNDRSVDATVVDLCPECASGSIDLSMSAFAALAPLDVGRLRHVVWNFN